MPPAPASTLLLAQLRQHLVAVELAREPEIAGAAHPMYLEPKDGAVAPGTKQGAERDPELVLSVFASGGLPEDRHERFLRTDTVDIWVRARTAPGALSFEPLLRDEFHDRRAWRMGDMDVVESLQWRPFQRLGSDANGYVFIVSYSFQHWSGLAVNA